MKLDKLYLLRQLIFRIQALLDDILLIIEKEIPGQKIEELKLKYHSVLDVAQLMGISDQKLFELMHDIGLIYRQNDKWYARAEHLQNHNLKVIETLISTGDKVNQILISDKGRSYIEARRLKVG